MKKINEFYKLLFLRIVFLIVGGKKNGNNK